MKPSPTFSCFALCLFLGACGTSPEDGADTDAEVFADAGDTDTTEDSGGGDDTGGEPVDCTTDVRPSVRVTVVDPWGEAVNYAAVRYTTVENPRFEDWITCEGLAGDSNVYICGYEVSGLIYIRGEVPGGGPTSELSVEVESDECHVITEEVTLEVDPYIVVG